MKSFVARFLLFGLVVTLLSIVGSIAIKFVAMYVPSEGLRSVVGAGA